AVEVVGDLLQEYAQQERQASFEQWRARLEDNVVQQMAWVKKRADEAHAASKPPGPLAAIDCMPLQRILASLPRPEGVAVSLSITAEGLRKATKCMLHKACGPDQWDAASLLRLPGQFWEGLAAVWNQALSCNKAVDLILGFAACVWSGAGGLYHGLSCPVA
ncbi:Ptchd3, partial [Symbiodinium pilosum]